MIQRMADVLRDCKGEDWLNVSNSQALLVGVLTVALSLLSVLVSS